MKTNKLMRINYVFKNNWIEFFIVTFIGLILSLITIYKIIFSPGYIILAEQLEVHSLERFINLFYPAWNGQIQMFLFTDLPKIYLYGTLVLIAKAFNLSFREVEMIILSAPTMIGFVSAYYLNKIFILKTRDNLEYKFIFIISMVAAFVYVVNPWVADSPRNILLRFGFAFIPLVFLMFLKLIEEPRIKNAIYFAFVISFVAGYRYYFVLAPLFLITLILFFFYLNNNKSNFKHRLIRVLLGLMLAGILVSLFALGKFLPAILYDVSTKSLSAVQQFTWGMVGRLDSIALIITKMTNLPGIAFDITYNDNTYIYFAFITALSFIYLLDKKNIKKPIIFLPALIYIFYALLVLKNPSLDNLLMHLPYSDYLGRLLRHARWNIMPIILAISVGIGLSLSFLISLAKKYRSLVTITLCLFVIVLASISAWPILTGDMNQYWSPAKIPEGYIITNNYIQTYRGEYHAIWMPTFGGRKAIWSTAVTPYEVGAPVGAFALYSSGTTTYYYSMIYFFDYYNPIGKRPFYRPFNGYKGSNWDKIYGPLNIRFLIIHYDIKLTTGEEKKGFNNILIKSIAEKIERNNILKVLYKGKYLSALEITNPSPRLDITTPIYAIGGLPIYGILADSGVNLSNFGILYSAQEKFPLGILNEAKYVLMKSGKDFYYGILNKGTLITPSAFVVRNINPQISWSYTYSVNSYSFQNELKNKGLTNWDWNFDYGEGLVVTWASNTTLKIPLNIEKSDNYKLFIRYFKNQKGGEIKVYLDGKPIIINTNDQLNKFVWKDFGTFKLNKGKHELILENVNGFNAVNLFTLIPEGEYYKARGEITKLLQNKTMIYLFEAESDLYRENAKIVKGIDYSNGEAIKFSKNGKAWQTLDIIKNGTYKLALKGSGEFKISLGNYTDIVSLNTNNFTYTPLFYLNQGTYNIKITPISSINNLVKIEDMPVLDVVWLYSTETNQTIGQLFEVKERPAKVINYTKINPTLWKVRVNATKPFMLNFAEAYDPLWEASIYKNGRKVEVAKSIPLYSVINGYWINQTGNLEITIRYKPQVWFDRGLIISLVTFIGAIGYLFYDWRRDKEDRWAKRLEKRFKR